MTLQFISFIFFLDNVKQKEMTAIVKVERIDSNEKTVNSYSEDCSKLESFVSNQPLDLSTTLVEEIKTDQCLKEYSKSIADNAFGVQGRENDCLLICDSNKENLKSNSKCIEVTITRPDEKENYQPCDLFLNDIAKLVPKLIEKDCVKIDILDKTCKDFIDCKKNRLYYIISETTWRMFKSTNERIILTNDQSLGLPIQKKEKVEKPTFLVFDQYSLAKCLKDYCQEIGACFEYTCVDEAVGDSNSLREQEGDSNEDTSKEKIKSQLKLQIKEKKNFKNKCEESEKKEHNEELCKIKCIDTETQHLKICHTVSSSTSGESNPESVTKSSSEYLQELELENSTNKQKVKSNKKEVKEDKLHGDGKILSEGSQNDSKQIMKSIFLSTDQIENFESSVTNFSHNINQTSEPCKKFNVENNENVKTEEESKKKIAKFSKITSSKKKEEIRPESSLKDSDKNTKRSISKLKRNSTNSDVENPNPSKVPRIRTRSKSSLEYSHRLNLRRSNTCQQSDNPKQNINNVGKKKSISSKTVSSKLDRGEGISKRRKSSSVRGSTPDKGVKKLVTKNLSKNLKVSKKVLPKKIKVEDKKEKKITKKKCNPVGTMKLRNKENFKKTDSMTRKREGKSKRECFVSENNKKITTKRRVENKKCKNRKEKMKR